MKVEPLLYGDRKVYTVASFNRGVADWLQRLPTLWIEGEMTELRRSERWGSVFFTLKDPADGACLPASIPRRTFDALKLDLTEGERIHVLGRPELFAAKGEFRLRALSLERFGLGAHLAAIERLKQKLADEGLFDAAHKRPLPRFPRRIGLVTGTDAAARQDVITTIHTRFPPARILVAETLVGAARRARDRRGAQGDQPRAGHRRCDPHTRGAAASTTCFLSATRRRPRCRLLPGAGRFGGRARQDTPPATWQPTCAPDPTAAALVVPDLEACGSNSLGRAPRSSGVAPADRPRARGLTRTRSALSAARADRSTGIRSGSLSAIDCAGSRAPRRAAALDAGAHGRSARSALAARHARPRLRDRARGRHRAAQCRRGRAGGRSPGRAR
jgi:hypothetical protein